MKSSTTYLLPLLMVSGIDLPKPLWYAGYDERYINDKCPVEKLVSVQGRGHLNCCFFMNNELEFLET